MSTYRYSRWDGSQQLPMLNVSHRDGDELRHFWGAELFYAPTDPGEDPRHTGTIEPLWNLFDLTRPGRVAKQASRDMGQDANIAFANITWPDVSRWGMGFVSANLSLESQDARNQRFLSYRAQQEAGPDQNRRNP